MKGKRLDLIRVQGHALLHANKIQGKMFKIQEIVIFVRSWQICQLDRHGNIKWTL